MTTLRRNLPELRQRGLAPWRDYDRLFGGVNRLFEGFLMPWEAGFTPPVDAKETDTHYLLSFDLPGIDKSDLKIELRDNQLVVTGERKEEFETEKEEEGKLLTSERYYGTFSRMFTLPADVDPDRIEADYSDGVLRIAISKTRVETKMPRKIEIGGTEGKSSFLGKLIDKAKGKPEKAA